MVNKMVHWRFHLAFLRDELIDSNYIIFLIAVEKINEKQGDGIRPNLNFITRIVKRI